MQGFKWIPILVAVSLSLMNCQALREYKERIAAIEIDNIDLQTVADGEYTGEYDAIIIKAAVKVVVKNHKIETIKLLRHENGRGGDAEVIPAM
ncbi:MAG: hypothetical protein Q7J65_00605 [Candidatus Marinimicrobia bacterium]|nr:hypothetical protein [Candidatus Neomarinimicrobiota bacterium]